MKFSVGWGQRADSRFVDEIIKHKEHIGEVYFSWGNYANGRNSQLNVSGLSSIEAASRQAEELKKISDAGIPLNVLFNAMCYGRHSQSRSFFEGIGETVEHLANNYKLTSVTTTSLLIARFIKENFKGLDVRASVNMGIGTIEGLEYVKDYFDSFYAARELNRNLSELKRIRKWCDDNGKRLYGLANSGCLNYCSAHTFHDNLVAHEAEIAQMDNGYAFKGVCSQYLKNEANRKAVFDNTSYIRPEDVHIYEDIFSGMKLASRVNRDPVRVLSSYVKGHAVGSTLSLLEPDHTALLYPFILENSRIEAQIQDGRLVYKNLENALVKLEDDIC